VLAEPAHPCTRALRAAAPRFFAPQPEPLAGEIPSPTDLPPGRRFAGRRPVALTDCRRADPPLVGLSPDRSAACLQPMASA
jgi:oligopeptide/dipeptide ABC transporter ATP-binding protein